METRCSALLEIINILESQQKISMQRQELFAAMQSPEQETESVLNEKINKLS